ncbi:transcription initiation factor TFIID subunit 15 [Salvia miltiorrhiza]|uniref:transcription initiation factor TFIID subunit 15 n=1 Tax=Salvia miltiorrhiza TaxID=226208 RepID=UPI0025AD6881|nr:transcription initiation factor TFIID subunit 15 [Salvia miltiorrhiza]XP_057778348.1 transcription initiation factor TFIID subunit 15 [Salvia miltiorrhiza]
MANYSGKGAPTNGSVYVCNLPPGTDETMLAEHFGTIGLLKKDKRTGRPKIWLYHDKVTNEPKGDAMVTYEDPHAALAAVEWFNNKDFHGATIGVCMAESKNKDDTTNHVGDQAVVTDVNDLEEASVDVSDGGGRGRGRGDAGGKPWQQDGDWLCTNTSCGNVNFAFRGVCNRCGTARPAGASGGGAAGGGRGRGRGNSDAGGPARGAGAAGGGLFGPNDWPCPMCGNINWAKRTKCNICNTNKPGTSEGGVRGGRGGGYKELDEEEIEETKRRRRAAEEDDGEMYDEFGNLKKKFRAKTQAETTQAVPGVGRAGWEVEELGDKDKRERSKDRGRDRDDRERDRHRSSRDHDRHRDRDRGYEYDRDRDYGRERERDRDRGRYR